MYLTKYSIPPFDKWRYLVVGVLRFALHAQKKLFKDFFVKFENSLIVIENP